MRRLTLGALALAACSFEPAAAVSGDAAPSRDAQVDSGPPILGRRKSLTFPGAAVTGELTDFPVWVDLADADIATRATGSDLYFTDAAGSALAYELVQLGSGGVRAWVRLPSLHANTAAKFYIAYGDPAKATAANAAAVFSNQFAAVWHFDDDFSAPSVADATGAADGTPVGLGSANSTPAKLGGGLLLAGSANEGVRFTSSLLGGTPHTISAWVNANVIGRHAIIMWVGAGVNEQARYFWSHGDAGTPNIEVGYFGDDFTNTARDIEGSGWQLLAWTSEGSNRQNHLFIDGVETTTFTQVGAPDTTTTAGYIGGFAAVAPGYTLDGTLDEVRIATVARPAAWLALEYANQKAASTFFTVGPDEPQP